MNLFVLFVFQERENEVDGEIDSNSDGVKRLLQIFSKDSGGAASRVVDFPVCTKYVPYLKLSLILLLLVAVSKKRTGSFNAFCQQQDATAFIKANSYGLFAMCASCTRTGR